MEIKDNNLYYVGGYVRDEILGVPSFDTDYCYEGNAIDFAKDLNVIKTNPDFGTVRVVLNSKEIDIASTRTESYPQKGHLPVVDKIGCSLKEDLKRRDFTINALAKNTISGEIIDYFDGQNDIKQRKIRVLHEESFIDDPSRILRALKFSVRFDFELEEDTQKLQDEYLKNINYDMSFHRLKKELKETFNLNSQNAFERFVNQKIYKLLGKNQPLPKTNCSIADLITKYNPNNPWLVYLGQFNLENFELTSEEYEIVNNYKNIKNTIPKSDFECYKIFKHKPLETVLLYAISVNEDIAVNFLENLNDIRINITGDDLKELGVKQGKIYKEILDFVLEEKIKKPKMTKDDELIILKSRFGL